MSVLSVGIYVGCGEHVMNTFLWKRLRHIEQDGRIVYLKKRHVGM